jgi:hypothetical protein
MLLTVLAETRVGTGGVGAGSREQAAPKMSIDAMPAAQLCAEAAAEKAYPSGVRTSLHPAALVTFRIQCVS